MKKYFLVFTLAIVACSTSPTGRRQLAFMPESQMTQMGVESFQALKQKLAVAKDKKLNDYVKCVTDPLIAEAGNVKGVSNWELVVFKDESANAFALPGGRIGVHTGLLKVANTPDQLAAVIGHEIGHVMARHGNERVSQALTAQGITLGANIYLSREGKLDKKDQLILAGLGIGAQFGVLLPFSRAHESEADIIGLELMAKAGFDPEESVQLWRNMAKANGGKQAPEFLSTHPSSSSRIKNLSKHIPKVRGHYEAKKAQRRLPTCSL